MWKKAVPAFAMCSLLLVGCGTDEETVPSNNETPMEDYKRDVNELEPNVNTPSPGDNGNNQNQLNQYNPGRTGNGPVEPTENMQEETITDENKWIKEPTTENEKINNGTVE